jgi:hypothetical protein
MKVLLIFLFLGFTSCCTNSTIDIQIQLRDRINEYQSTASEAYQAGRMEKYEYWRGKADGVADAREIFEAER